MNVSLFVVRGLERTLWVSWQNRSINKYVASVQMWKQTLDLVGNIWGMGKVPPRALLWGNVFYGGCWAQTGVGGELPSSLAHLIYLPFPAWPQKCSAPPRRALHLLIPLPRGNLFGRGRKALISPSPGPDRGRRAVLQWGEGVLPVVPCCFPFCITSDPSPPTHR